MLMLWTDIIILFIYFAHVWKPNICKLMSSLGQHVIHPEIFSSTWWSQTITLSCWICTWSLSGSDWWACCCSNLGADDHTWNLLPSKPVHVLMCFCSELTVHKPRDDATESQMFLWITITEWVIACVEYYYSLHSTPCPGVQSWNGVEAKTVIYCLSKSSFIN